MKLVWSFRSFDSNMWFFLKLFAPSHHRIDYTIWFSFISVDLHSFFFSLYGICKHSTAPSASIYVLLNDFNRLTETNLGNFRCKHHTKKKQPLLLWIHLFLFRLCKWLGHSNAICHDCNHRPCVQYFKRLGFF